MAKRIGKVVKSYLMSTFQTSRTSTGLIAEEVEELGFNEFVIYDDNGEIEGIAYDRLWVHLIPIIKNQQSKLKTGGINK
ncbi:hypothetical protein WOC68_10225 [Staphylococcus aureus]